MLGMEEFKLILKVGTVFEFFSFLEEMFYRAKLNEN